MAWMKTVADGLTGLRMVAVVLLPLYRLLASPFNLNHVGGLVLVAWVTDALDGPLARRSGVQRQTWMGRSDLYTDVALALMLLLVLCSAGLVHPLVALAHVLLWGFALWRCGGLTKPLGALFQGPVYLWLGLSLLSRRLLMGRVMLAWVVGLVGVTWSRLVGRDIPEFLHGARETMASLAGHRPQGG